MEELKTSAAKALQFKLNAEPGKWSFLFGNGINRHIFHEDCKWDELLQKIGGKQKYLDKTTYLKDKAFRDIYELIDKKDSINEEALYKMLRRFNAVCDNDTSLIELFTLINKNNTEKTKSDFLKELASFNKPDKDYFKRLRECLIRLDIPVFTTNFDHNIEGADCKKTILPPKSEINASRKEHREFSSRYPWNVCYSNIKKTTAQDGYAVWHIHGDIEYKSSIQLGVSEYGGSLTRAHNFLYEDAKDEAGAKYKTKRKARFYKEPLSEKWRGYDTWLHPFFSHHLCIIGFGMDKTESFVRWLINERSKFSHFLSENRSKYPSLDLTLDSMFIDCETNINYSKFFYLEKYGFQIITFKTNEYDISSEDLTKPELIVT